MKIIEALKNLKTIQKRMEKNCAEITLYCAYVNTETPAFETEDKQRAEVRLEQPRKCSGGANELRSMGR